MNRVMSSAFFDELNKIASSARDPSSPWAPKTVGAPRSSAVGTSAPNAPATPGNMAPHNVAPVAKYGPQDTSVPNPASTSETKPNLELTARIQQPPNVVFGAR